MSDPFDGVDPTKLMTMVAIFNRVFNADNNTLKVNSNLSIADGTNLEATVTDEVVALDPVDDTQSTVEPKKYIGLSTNTKPTTNVVIYSTFTEMDTLDRYYWDGTTWNLMNI